MAFSTYARYHCGGESSAQPPHVPAAEHRGRALRFPNPPHTRGTPALARHLRGLLTCLSALYCATHSCPGLSSGCGHHAKHAHTHNHSRHTSLPAHTTVFRRSHPGSQARVARPRSARGSAAPIHPRAGRGQGGRGPPVRAPGWRVRRRAPRRAAARPPTPRAARWCAGCRTRRRPPPRSQCTAPHTNTTRRAHHWRCTTAHLLGRLSGGGGEPARARSIRWAASGRGHCVRAKQVGKAEGGRGLLTSMTSSCRCALPLVAPGAPPAAAAACPFSPSSSSPSTLSSSGDQLVQICAARRQRQRRNSAPRPRHPTHALLAALRRNERCPAGPGKANAAAIPGR